MKKFIFLILLSLCLNISIASTADDSTPLNNPVSKATKVPDQSDPTGKAIDIGLGLMLVLTAGFGSIRLYQFLKEKRLAAREEEREKALWR